MRKMLFFASLLLGLSACEKDPDMNQLDADLVVYTDYDKDADFGSYKTYFLPDSILEAGGYRATYWKDENAKAIINKVAAEMDARGYTRILDPEKKEEANVGLQLSYVAQTTQVITGGYWGGWWDYGFWGPWSGWYYPYPVVYSYSVGSLLVELVNLKAPLPKSADAKLPVLWTAYMTGLLSGSDKVNIELSTRAIEQAFVQSPYLKK